MAQCERTIQLVEAICSCINVSAYFWLCQIDLACTTGETATSRQMPISSWLVQAYKAGALTEATDKLLQALGFTVEYPKDQEPEVAWTKPTDEEEQVLTACLNVISLGEGDNCLLTKGLFWAGKCSQHQ